jgi:hypothetical protein
MYEISNYSYERAKDLGVKIRPSTTYMKTKGKEYAEERRRLYHLRHKKDLERLGSRGYYSTKILW